MSKQLKTLVKLKYPILSINDTWEEYISAYPEQLVNKIWIAYFSKKRFTNDVKMFNRILIEELCNYELTQND